MRSSFNATQYASSMFSRLFFVKTHFLFSSVLFSFSSKSIEMASSSTATQNQNAFDQLAPCSAPKSTEPWDIFINHRGSDVKFTLAKTIHHKLHSLGFHVFLDVDALDAGDSIPAEIQQAITCATFHLAIFSPNYAQSPWCLAELSFMLQTGKTIIPIFYRVDPSDLRWVEKGKYADAFSEHESKGRYTIEKLDEWKGALHNTSFLSGYLVNSNEDEATVLKNIVNRALAIMKKTPLWVAEHPLGLDELVQGFESLAVEETVKIRGIVGMGGSGKTTLAKELFNRNFSSFQKCSFVFDVRDAASRNALPDKQRKLLADLNFPYLPFDHVDEGKVVLANRLSSHGALIVLDDVDHIDQLNALLPSKNSLGSQSMVIVTTRDLGVLLSWGISPSSIFKMRGLNPSHAKQLFCWHAFLQPSPPAEFQTLVQDFVEACDALPLSLKVLGAQLYGRKSAKYWKSILHKISRILPSEIKKRLQVSYNALDQEEREMFLDVACFLIGEEEGTAIAVWDGSDWSGLCGLETLVNKCLVELVKENVFRPSTFFYRETRVIRMHDHLRDMGREIASKRSPYRLWCPQQIDKMKLSTRKIPVRGILPADSFVAFKEYTQQSTGKAVRRSKRLRFSYGLQILSVKANEFTEEFASLSQDLVWLRWEDFPLKNFPSWFALKNLKILEINSGSKLEELWQDDAEPPSKLSELILTGCRKLQRFPSSFKNLQDLKSLAVEFVGSSLSEDQFCVLPSLQNLQLFSQMLTSLPDGFGNLTSLKNLSLQGCVQLSMLPDSFSQLIHLTNLDLSDCTELSSLPDDFGYLTSLTNLEMYSCSKLSMLPDSFTQLLHLTDLDLSCCEMLFSLPDGFGDLTSLRNLKMYHCSKLSMLPDSFTQLLHLEILHIPHCEMLYLLLDNSDNLRSLKNLRLSKCNQLSVLPDSFSQLIRLEILSLSDCEMLSSLPDNFGNLSSLRSLFLINCKRLCKWPVSFSQLHLTYLDLSGCEMISSLPEMLPVLLNKLTISACHSLKSVRCISHGLTNLETLEIFNCLQIEELPSFTGLASLKKIQIFNCPEVEKIEGLEHVRRFEMRNCAKVEKIQGLEHVWKFVMSNCPKLMKVEGLEHAKWLKELTLKTSWKEAGIQSLGNVERFKVLQLECEAISALKPCIRSTRGKECAREMWIKGSAIRLEEPIVNYLEAISNLKVFKPPAVDGDSDAWHVPEIPDRDFFISSGKISGDVSYLYYVEQEEGYGEERKVVCMCYTENTKVALDRYFPPKTAIKVSGKREGVLEAFYQILELLE